ncbi:bacteriophage T4 gp5 trimerisation domain-containing protein [Polyangium jinanense]|uniref:bacteriophage T4 gp5 trimerisation domain-containing protein n=1 Tax=Polyangium jinanense TaxID=2829994 RepID=UPI00355A8E09
MPIDAQRSRAPEGAGFFTGAEWLEPPGSGLVRAGGAHAASACAAGHICSRSRAPKEAWRTASSPGGNGYNEILFEDKKGGEFIRVHAERDRAESILRSSLAVNLAAGRIRSGRVFRPHCVRTLYVRLRRSILRSRRGLLQNGSSGRTRARAHRRGGTRPSIAEGMSSLISAGPVLRRVGSRNPEPTARGRHGCLASEKPPLIGFLHDWPELHGCPDRSGSASTSSPGHDRCRGGARAGGMYVRRRA